MLFGNFSNASLADAAKNMVRDPSNFNWTFIAIFASTLSASGFVLVRLLDRPWEIWSDRSRAAATAESGSY